MRGATHRLLGRGIVVVEVAAQQAQPVLQLQHAVVHKVAGTGLDQQDALAGQILGQARGDDTAGSAAAHDHVVIAVDVGGGEDSSGRHVGCRS